MFRNVFLVTFLLCFFAFRQADGRTVSQPIGALYLPQAINEPTQKLTVLMGTLTLMCMVNLPALLYFKDITVTHYTIS